MSALWPYGRLKQLAESVEQLERAMNGYEVLAALEAINRANTRLMEIAADIVEIAGAETTITQKRLAEALDVPPSALRGLRQRY